MPTTDELLARGRLSEPNREVLHRLLADWQLLSDLSFADLLLLVPVDIEYDDFPRSLRVAAQIRPTTGPTAYQDDLIGRPVTLDERPQLLSALRDGRIAREGDPEWRDGVPIREEALPVRLGDEVVAIVARDTNLLAARTPSRLEIAYLNSANDLAQMLAEGRWPYPGESLTDGGGPRVGDGLIRLDAEGIVNFASPNALSAYRRLGHLADLVGFSLADVTAGLAERRHEPIDEPITLVARGRVSRSGDVETADAVVALRALPLHPGGRHIGALVLVRDVTDLRRRERLLLSKDATIREIHHRVKNNLQTVAALLRLQARRVGPPEAREALEESVRRVSSIAVVHETLSGTLEETVEFDEVADRVVSMVTEVAASPVAIRRTGSFGVLSAEVATPLAMVLTELVQNAVEHGYPMGAAGTVRIEVERGDSVRSQNGEHVTVRVVDDGRGLPADFVIDGSDSLGLQIVRTLVETELGGQLTLGAGTDGGTAVTVEL